MYDIYPNEHCQEVDGNGSTWHSQQKGSKKFAVNKFFILLQTFFLF